MTFTIFEHDGRDWKLYDVRYANIGKNDYTYELGGVACRAGESNDKYGEPYVAGVAA